VPSWKLESLKPALDAVRAWKPDVVHIQHPSQGYDGPLPLALGTAVRWSLGIPVVSTLHEPVNFGPHLPLMAALIRSSAAIVVVRHNFRQLVNWKAAWAIAGTRLRFIPNATTLPRVARTADGLRAIRARYHAGDKPIVSYFGFIYPNRGVHQLFDIADPARHQLVIVGGSLREAEGYHEDIVRLAGQDRWKDACVLAGFLAEEDAADVLACSDAVVLPFLLGGGSWNTSLHGARLQGTFVVTTSRESRGYDALQNVYYAEPSNIAQMREGLDAHIGTRREPADIPTWDRVAADHLDIYRDVTRA
jgi:glycosyltransferase involved in cell wall biosynthesis